MKKKINKIAKDTNLYLRNFISKQGDSKLIPAMKYGLFPGGKKIRSKILVDIGSLLSINYKTLIIIGAAVECIHAYSLIHDDLPCMDDDKERRGKASTHVKFGESTAVLAGNSLQTMACEILASPSLKLKEEILAIRKFRNNNLILYYNIIFMSKASIVYFIFYKRNLAPRVGFEPTTDRLTVDCSTTELPRKI